jgi:hypothetical protein
VAKKWLRFAGRLKSPPAPVTWFTGHLQDFARRMTEEQGLSPLSVRSHCWKASKFLTWFTARHTCLSRVRLQDVDGFLALKGTDSWSRTSVSVAAQALRAFFRHAERHDQPLFQSRLHKAVPRQVVEAGFRRLCNLANVRREEVSPYQPRVHDLRHTFTVHRLTEWYRDGSDVQAVGLRDLEKQLFRGLLVIGPIEQDHTSALAPGSSRVVLKRKSRISSWSALILAPFFFFFFFCWLWPDICICGGTISTA